MGNGKVSEQIMGREPYRFMFMESLENFKEQIQICSIEKQFWNSGGRGEATDEKSYDKRLAEGWVEYRFKVI